MKSCQDYQSHLLDHLYGLLDEAESVALVQHLERCSGCKAALIVAEGQKKLLAAAAKTQFPNLRFETPAAPVPAAGTATLEAPRGDTPPAEVSGSIMFPAAGRTGSQAMVSPVPKTSAGKALQRWALAAAVLLAVGLGVPGALSWHADRVVHATQAHFQELSRLRDERLAAVRRSVYDKHLYLTITGPESIEPGAPNEFQIETRNLNHQAVPADVSVLVRDQDQKVIYQEERKRSAGVYRLALPRDLQLKPHAALSLEVVAKGDNGPQGELREKLPLASPLYITHLTTDKPMYHPGEVVSFRSLTLERFSLKPAEQDFQLAYTITSPSGADVFRQAGLSRLLRSQDNSLVLGPDQQPLRGIGAGEFLIPEESPGGEYTLTVSEVNNRFPPERRKFLVNQYEKPRLNKELEFTRKSFGPGDEVVAACRVTRVEGGLPVANQLVLVTVRVDGTQLDAEGKPSNSPVRLQTDSQGTVSVRFKLPVTIERGEASLSVNVTDGGNNETIVRPIPIVLKKLQVQFFPEGGDLVVGAPNRVYFQARTPLDKPAELQGRIIDEAGNVVVSEVRTLNDADQPGANQGMGVFAFTPAADRRYELKIDSPAGIEGRYPLPPAKVDGVVLSVPGGVTSDQVPIRVTVHSANKDRHLLIGAYCRGRLIDHQTVLARQGEGTTVELAQGSGVGGVYRVTVFEQVTADGRRQVQPVAERLVYRIPTGQLNLTLRPNKPRHVPGDAVTVSVVAANEKGVSTPAVLLVAVVDKSVLTLADEKTGRSMPTHFYLTTEVRRPEDLEHADFLLSHHVKAAATLDLLLGTQGWRRFAEQDPNDFRQKHKEDADRLLAAIGQSPAMMSSAVKVETACQPQLQQEMQAAQAALDREARAAHSAHLAAAGNLAFYRNLVWRIALSGFAVGLPVLTLVLLIVGIVRSVSASARDRSTLNPIFLTGICSVALCGLVFVGIFWTNQAGSTFSKVAMHLGDAERPAQAARDLDAAGMPVPMAELAPAPPIDALAAGAAPPALPDALGRIAREEKAENGRLGLYSPNRTKQVRPGRPGTGDLRGLQLRRLAEALDRAPAGAKRMGDLEARQLDRPRKDDLPLLAGRPKEAEALGRKPLLADGDFAQPMPTPFVVREYAHQRVRSQDGVRSDFAETLYWHPVLVLPNGHGQFSFELCDSVTTFQVAAAGHTLDGRLGSVTTTLEARLPFTVEPKLPVEVTASDQIDLPVTIANDTDAQRPVSLRVTPNGLTLTRGQASEALTLDANQRTRRLFRLQPAIIEGEARLLLEGRSGDFAGDNVLRSLRVVPDGFPVVGSKSDVLEKVAVHEVVLPETWVKGTLKCQVQVYPSTLADLQKGLDSLLREPCGCFEQSSSSNYPNVLTLDYLRATDQAKPEVARRARELLDRGYQKLTSFECQNPVKGKKEGYEWFGGTAPPHEALTAYGLLQFRDMARVYEVDAAMVERTRQYLLASRDGKGGFKRNARALDSFGRAPDDITNAYIVWALSESGSEDALDQELSALSAQAKTSKDPYFLALVANSLLNRGKAAEGVALLKTVGAAQQKDGHLDAARTSITGSGGRDLQIETTALAVLAWLKANRPADFQANVQAAVKWLGQQRGGYGGFGATQSTILALKALIAFTQANKKTAEAGELILSAGDQPIARKRFPAGAQEALELTLPEADKHLKPGKNSLRVEITGNNVFPYTLAWSYQTLKPANTEGCPVRLNTRLSRQTANEGDTVQLAATVENTSAKGLGMVVAIIGLPAGLTLPEDMSQLKDYARLRNDGTEPGLISHWETRGREVILYWRDLAPNKKVEVNLDLIARVPGEYRGPASRAYLYYNADHKHWVEPLRLTITPKGAN